MRPEDVENITLTLQDRGHLDGYIADLLIAYKQCAALYDESKSPTVKRRAKRIQLQISSAVAKLSGFGVSAEYQFKRVKSEFEIN